MYEVTVGGSFSAVHWVRLEDGQCETPHQHRWSVEACFAGPELDSAGILVDFTQVQQALRRISAELEGADLNTCPFMAGLNPTAEYVARSIYHALAGNTSRPGLLAWVRVGEGPGCTATYRPARTAARSSSPGPVDDENDDS